MFGVRAKNLGRVGEPETHIYFYCPIKVLLSLCHYCYDYSRVITALWKLEKNSQLVLYMYGFIILTKGSPEIVSVLVFFSLT